MPDPKVDLNIFKAHMVENQYRHHRYSRPQAATNSTSNKSPYIFQYFGHVPSSGNENWNIYDDLLKAELVAA